MALPSDARVLVTGATGFLGAHVLERFAAEDVDLHRASRSGGPETGPGTGHAVDLLDRAEVSALITRLRPTHLIHCAWMAVPGKFWTDPSNLDWLDAGIALLRAFRDTGGQRFVGLGTCAEYDWSGDRFVEDETPIRPATLYGQSKAAMWAATQAHAQDSFSAAWARIFLPYGVRDSEKRLVRGILAALRAGEPVALGSGAQERDFIWAPDLADGVGALAASGAEGAFNLGTGTGTTVREAAEYLGARIGRRELLKFGTRPDPVAEPARLVADMTKMQTAVGWTAKTPLRTGLDVIIETV